MVKDRKLGQTPVLEYDVDVGEEELLCPEVLLDFWEMIPKRFRIVGYTKYQTNRVGMRVEFDRYGFLGLSVQYPIGHFNQPILPRDRWCLVCIYSEMMALFEALAEKAKFKFPSTVQFWAEMEDLT